MDDINKTVASGSEQPQLPISTMDEINVIMPKLRVQKIVCHLRRPGYKSKFSGRVCNSKYKLVLQLGIDKIHQLFYSLIQEFFG